MPKVQAWQCKHTKALFPIEQEKEFKRHTQTAYRQIKAQEKIAREKAEYASWLAAEKYKCKTIKQVSTFLEKNFDKIQCRWGETGKRPEIKSIAIAGEYRERCSNTHSCPHNGVTNWYCKDDFPKGYPGIYGRINIKVKENNYYGFLSDYFTKVGVFTGSGGNGNYDVTLWLDDWPGIKETVLAQRDEWEKQRVINVLAGEKSSIFRVKWEDE